MVKTPRPPFIGTKPPKRGHEGAYHRNERGETWTRERGQSLNAAQTAAVCSPFVVSFATLQARAPTSSRGKDRAAQKGQSLNAARRMVGAGRVFCPPRVQYSPPARKPETDGRRAFSFGRVLDAFPKYRNSTDYAEKITTFAPVSGVFSVFLDVFWTYSGKEPKNTGAAETTRRVFQTRKHETPRVVSVVETHAGGFRYGRNRRRPPRKGDDRKPTKR